MRIDRIIGAAAIALAIAGCGGQSSTTQQPPTPSVQPTGSGAQPTESGARHGIDGLVADLVDEGADATIGESLDGQPLAIQQTIVCAGSEDVRVFVYGTEQERIAASSRIDPDDPSNVGTAIVEWAGWPKFWQRDRIIVLYLGRDEATINALTNLMGEPFAAGQDQPQRLPGAC